MVAPAGAATPSAIAAGLAWLRSCGWVPVPARHLHERHRYFAGRREARLADLAWALTAPDIDAVWFARGGYGTAQLLNDLPWERMDDRPVIGFSDATALEWALARRGIVSVHGPVLTTLGARPSDSDEESRAKVWRLLTTGESALLEAEHLCGPTRHVRARVVGGNLTVLAALAGTTEALVGAGHIVLLEDARKSTSRLEQSLDQLIQSGGLDGARGVALGEFVGCEPSADARFQLTDVWVEHLEPLGVPVVHRLPVGHGPQNHAFPYGAEAWLTTDGLDFSTLEKDA